MTALRAPSGHLVFGKLLGGRIKFCNPVLIQHVDPYIVVLIDVYGIWLAVAVGELDIP